MCASRLSLLGSFSLSLSLDVDTQIWFKDNSGLRNDA